MTKVSIHRLVQIYKDNKVLEGGVELTGAKAKLLINRCKEAQKIMKKEFPDESGCAEALSKHIEKMEDSLAKWGHVLSIDYNLDARIQIHMVCRDYNLFQVREGWLMIWDEVKEEHSYHWIEDGEPVCKDKGEMGNEEPSWRMNRDSCCKKCVKHVIGLIKKDHEKEDLNDKDVAYSGSAYGLQFEYEKGKFTEKRERRYFGSKNKIKLRKTP